ncbi:RNase adaptor protein RapZ [Limnohabitans sp. JirII-29]|uniref:RNase adapter RapZ n=1 Tax=unclassified Limnohabitans TaxID=2626134 RepID=UPI000C1F66D4|nr:MULTISPECIES: RNase adapter RapZ [unclassified Limnohabitans]PIT80415.1 RNase adaptor protein RapZ [Limnohabitans sp. JirII-31]PUE26332.1 RNase adaptor protein RapZ [Limnohabitans sp. JirII-29]
MNQEIVLITGMSGSGKSVALHALEDAGYYCVDNLPPELLLPFVKLEQQQRANKVAIAMDVRSAGSLPLVMPQLSHLRALDVNVRPLFLDASTEVLVHRFSETRRRHPLSQQEDSNTVPDQQRDLIEAIELERQLLADLREASHIIDTSLLRNTKLQAYIKSLVSAPATQLTLMFESFAFKRGIPLHADYVFDVRMLPNPHYEPELRPLTGRDEPVAQWLKQHPPVDKMAVDISAFLTSWLPQLNQDHRSYVTVAIGCTGGQHRSVYLVERLSQQFTQDWVTLKRHRELDIMGL